MLSFFPKISFSTTEMVQIKEKLSDPLIKKYLTYLAIAESDDLIVNGEPKDNETADSFLRRQAEVRGKVDVLETLLLISEPEESTSDNSGNVAR